MHHKNYGDREKHSRPLMCHICTMELMFFLIINVLHITFCEIPCNRGWVLIITKKMEKTTAWYSLLARYTKTVLILLLIATVLYVKTCVSPCSESEDIFNSKILEYVDNTGITITQRDL